MTDDLWRLVAVLNLAVIFGSGVFLHQRHSGAAPYVLRIAAIGAGALLALVALGVVANALAQNPPTLGLKILAIGGAIIATGFFSLAVLAERHPERYLHR